MGKSVRVEGARMNARGRLNAPLVALCGGVLAGLLAGMVLVVSSAGAALPEGRVYEQVSPEFKAGYPVFSELPGTMDFATDGEAAKFNSIGGFAASGENFGLNPYVARRTPTGWVTSGLFPPGTGGVCWLGLEDMSVDLSRFEYKVSVGETESACETSPTESAWVGEPGGSFAQVSPVTTTAGEVENGLNVVGGSSDLSRLVIVHSDSPSEYLIPGDETETGEQPFEAEGASVLRLVAVSNAGKQITRYCDVILGGEMQSGGFAGAFGAVSQPAASEVFFSVAVNSYVSGGGACKVNPANPVEVFVRVNGVSTIEVSKPLSEACSDVPCPGAASRAPAVFQGASEDGSRVFFTTTQSLVGEDTDSSNDLYMARIGCAGGNVGEACGSAPRGVTSLVQVSRDPNAGQAADVEPAVLTVSADGSHAYFVARGALSTVANGQGETAVDGAENVYMYDASSTPGRVSFVADLCSGSERSGSVVDTRCPASSVSDQRLWSQIEARQVQTTADGGFLVFGTYARLIGSGPEADVDSARDVYVYDAATGVLRRVSIGEAGAQGNGNSSLFDASIAGTTFHGATQEQDELEDRAVSDDGSTVVFRSSEPLSSGATNGQQDVYVWHEGSVGMISSGSSIEPDVEPVITPSGRDIFFMTSTGLLTGDTDGLTDVYDARIGGGFPMTEAPREPCSGDACQGPLSSPGAMLVPGSVSQTAGGNVPVPVAVSKKAKAKAKIKKPKPKHKAKRKAKGGRARKSARGAVRGGHGR